MSKTEEGLDLMLRLWRDEQVDFQGAYYQASGAVLAPKPVQRPHPPLWFGVEGPRMMRLAARYADAWVPTQVSPAEYRQGMQHLQALRRELGVREQIKGALQHMDPFHEASGFLRSVKEYGEAGCEVYGVVWSYPPEDMVQRVRWFSREVMPRT